MEKFLFDNLEVIIGAVGGIGIAVYMVLGKNKHTNNENDLSHLYVRYKKHTDNISKSAKGMF